MRNELGVRRWTISLAGRLLGRAAGERGLRASKNWGGTSRAHAENLGQRGGSARHLQPRVDVVQVFSDRALRKLQPVCDLQVRVTVSHQRQ